MVVRVRAVTIPPAKDSSVFESIAHSYETKTGKMQRIQQLPQKCILKLTIIWNKGPQSASRSTFTTKYISNMAFAC